MYCVVLKLQSYIIPHSRHCHLISSLQQFTFNTFVTTIHRACSIRKLNLLKNTSTNISISQVITYKLKYILKYQLVSQHHKCLSLNYPLSTLLNPIPTCPWFSMVFSSPSSHRTRATHFRRWALHCPLSVHVWMLFTFFALTARFASARSTWSAIKQPPPCTKRK